MNWSKDGDPVEVWPSAEDEYLASLEVKPDYTAELILAMSTLTEKQRFVIERRFGVHGGPELTVCQIATLMGVSHVSIVRLEQRAMRRLRKALQKSPINAGFFDPSANVERA